MLTIESEDALPNEIWAAVTPVYYLSNMGRWYSVRKRHIMRQEPNSSGYLRANLWINGRRKHVLTHIKVVEIFGDCYGNRIPYGAITLRELGLSIDHRDRNTNNNTQYNLELVTHQENCKRKFYRP